MSRRDTSNQAETRRAAHELIKLKMPAIDALVRAQAEITHATDALHAARERLHTAHHDYAEHYRAARTTGWTTTELTHLGYPKPKPRRTPPRHNSDDDCASPRIVEASAIGSSDVRDTQGV